MTQITINLPNEAEAQWLVELRLRLQVPFEVEANETKKRERAKEIIMHGANTLDVAKMQKHVKQARQGRKLPFRAE
ncbi:hypothetical protein [Runella limosa]|uniref:hypothetical protein n=1 Tax=Runella limosa TaxID=370978 RepID=UPI00041A36FE|nr:hypothetical protein [Runella limosa]